jgi:hypothetical protein
MTIHDSMFRLLFIATVSVLIAILVPISQNPDGASGQSDASTVAPQQRTSSVEENKAVVKSAIEEIFNQ